MFVFVVYALPFCYSYRLWLYGVSFLRFGDRLLMFTFSLFCTLYLTSLLFLSKQGSFEFAYVQQPTQYNETHKQALLPRTML